jgi:hypothetical protein
MKTDPAIGGPPPRLPDAPPGTAEPEPEVMYMSSWRTRSGEIVTIYWSPRRLINAQETT